MNMSTTDEQRLREALDALYDAVRDAESAAHDLAGPAQRKDARESYAEAERCITALAQQAPTPAVLPDPPHCPQCNTASLQLRCTHCFADFPVPPTASEPAAPVNARDGLEQLFDLAKQYGYKLIPTPRAALTRQAAAPAEGEKT